MRSNPRSTLIMLLAVTLAQAAALRAAVGPITLQWTVDGVPREALIYLPPAGTDAPAPLIFAFHGHGGRHRSFARQLPLHTAWPEAMIVYPQGLNTPGRLTDPEGKRPGWQSEPGEQGDRDLRFFDTMLKSLAKDHRIDDQRIYATGHSNGGTMTYILWQARGETFAAFAPSGTAMGMMRRQRDALDPNLSKAARRPILHLAGTNDPLVKFAWQQHTIDALLKLNQCDAGGPWGEDCTIYPSPVGAPVITHIHGGGHELAPNAAEIVCRFFKEFPRPAKSASTQPATGGD